MTPNEFTAALAELGWSQAEFCRKAGVERSTPRRYIHETTPIPKWVSHFLEAMLEIKHLHKRFIEAEDRVEDKEICRTAPDGIRQQGGGQGADTPKPPDHEPTEKE